MVKMLSRIVYGLVGLSAVGMVYWALMNGVMSQGALYLVAGLLLVIGGLNWGIVAITGKKDLFALLGL